MATCCQEMAENNVDFAHFMYVHGTDAIPDDDFVIDGTYKRTTSHDGNFVREGFGLGLGVLRISRLHDLHLVDHPDRRRRTSRCAGSSPRPRPTGPTRPKEAAVAFSTGVSQDIPIWENKRYVERPVRDQEREEAPRAAPVGPAVLFELRRLSLGSASPTRSDR